MTRACSHTYNGELKEHRSTLIWLYCAERYGQYFALNLTLVAMTNSIKFRHTQESRSLYTIECDEIKKHKWN